MEGEREGEGGEGKEGERHGGMEADVGHLCVC